MCLSDSSKGQRNQRLYQFVWCSEQSVKIQSADLRSELGAVADRCGSKLLCLKKAAKYVEWRSSQRFNRPVVLITDWREAKPFVKTFEESSVPLITLVYCDSYQTFRRASIWANSVDPKFGVQVISTIAAVEPLVQSILQPEAARKLYRADETTTQGYEGVDGLEEAPSKSSMTHRFSLTTQEYAAGEKNVCSPAVQNTMIHLIFQSRRRCSIEGLLYAGLPDSYDD